MVDQASNSDSWSQVWGHFHINTTAKKAWAKFVEWFQQDVWEADTLVELGVLAVVFALSYFLGQALARRLRARWQNKPAKSQLARTWRDNLSRLPVPAVALVLLVALNLYTSAAGLDNDFINASANIIGAWLVIRLFASLLFKPLWAGFFAAVVWVVASLNILHLLPQTLNLLASLKIRAGDLDLSVLDILESVLVFIVLVRVGVSLGGYFHDRLEARGDLEHSTRSVVAFLTKALLFFLAAVISMEMIGIDMDMLTVFGGAFGFGLGIGLKVVFSNLVAGVIIMMDKSIKVGDVIQVDDVFGEVRALKVRFVSVVTRDGMEYLIPNEDFISHRVVNTSYSSREVRLRAPISVAYGSDVDLAIELAKEAAGSVERVLNDPPPLCFLVGMGDSAIDLELRFWIHDPANGIGNVKSKVYSEVLGRYAQHGIEIPFPQRDIHIKQMPGLPAE